MIGKLDRRITFLRRATTRNAMGELDHSYTEFSSTWAKVEKAITGDENEVLSGRQTPKRDVSFVVRYRTDLDEKVVIKFTDELGDKFYKIESINEVTSERRKAYIKIVGIKFDLEK